MGRRGGAAARGSIAAFVAFATLAVLASNAYAAATTNKAEWYTGSTFTTLTGKQVLTASAAEKIELAFPFGGLAIKMRANSASCIECSITNEASGHLGVATGTGRLLFSEAFFLEATTCKFKEDKITSQPLLFEAHYTEGERWLVKISPVSGETDLTLNIEANKPGDICPFEGSGTPVKGANFGEFKSKTGVFAVEQPVNFSLPISEEAGSNWTFGSQRFAVTGTLNLKAGGNTFGVK
ncbi:MAG TPA: hypothetical protein VGI17_07295 [Solirubrobacterales bacterium]|jgi:hypothetical protein